MITLQKSRGALSVAVIRIFTSFFLFLVILGMLIPLNSAFFLAAMGVSCAAVIVLILFCRARISRFRCVITPGAVEVQSGLVNLKRAVLRRDKIAYVLWLTTPLEVLFHAGAVVITYPGSLFILDGMSRNDYRNVLRHLVPEGRDRP